MSRVAHDKCDQCGKTVANGYAIAGWLKIDGHVTRAQGVYGPSSYRTAFIRDGGDFCGLACLLARLAGEDERLDREYPLKAKCACTEGNRAQ